MRYAKTVFNLAYTTKGSYPGSEAAGSWSWPLTFI